MKIWKAKRTYGLPIVDAIWSELHLGRPELPASTWMSKRWRGDRHAAVVASKHLMHPILCTPQRVGIQIHSAGQRLTAAYDMGYDGISAVVSDNAKLLSLLYDIQRAYAKNFFPYGCQETVEKRAPKQEAAELRLANYAKTQPELFIADPWEDYENSKEEPNGTSATEDPSGALLSST